MRNLVLGLPAVAAVSCTLAAVAGGRTALVTANLVRNGGAEIGPAAVNDVQTVVPTGWQTTSKFTSVLYGSHGGFPALTASAPIHGGRKFFAGGVGNPFSTATQKVRVPAAFLRGRADARLSADLGGFSSQGDNATVTARFLDAGGATLGSMHVGPVGSAARGSTTKLLLRSKDVSMPVGTVAIQVVISAKRLSGSYNDGYVDNVSLNLAH
jgi:hypothetical protein